MKTIRQRARAYAQTRNQNSYAYDGYIKGATEQRVIDIDKACEQFAEALENLRVKNADEYVKCFRKAMEGGNDEQPQSKETPQG